MQGCAKRRERPARECPRRMSSEREGVNGAAINKRRLESRDSALGFHLIPAQRRRQALMFCGLASFQESIAQKKTQFKRAQTTNQSRSTSQAPPSPQRQLQIMRSSYGFLTRNRNESYAPAVRHERRVHRRSDFTGMRLPHAKANPASIRKSLGLGCSLLLGLLPCIDQSINMLKD